MRTYGGLAPELLVIQNHIRRLCKKFNQMYDQFLKMNLDDHIKKKNKKNNDYNNFNSISIF